jgi:hypothetical protein
MNESAKAVLDLRVVRGEISQEEYTKTLALLAQGSTSTTSAQTPAQDASQGIAASATQPTSGQSATTKQKQPMSKGCMGCLVE